MSKLDKAIDKVLEIQKGTVPIDYQHLAVAVKTALACRMMRDEVIRLNPNWDSCEHEMEPNTTLGFISRCEKCGTRASSLAAITEAEVIAGAEVIYK